MRASAGKRAKAKQALKEAETMTRNTIRLAGGIAACVSLAVFAPSATAAKNLKLSGKPPAAIVGQSYEALIGVSGGTAPYTLAIESGALPMGLELSPSGEITGTPSKAETAVFTIIATDSSEPALHGHKKFKIKVASGVFPSGHFVLEETREEHSVGREEGEFKPAKSSKAKVTGTDFFEFPGTFTFLTATNSIHFTIEEFSGSPVEYQGTCEPVAETCSGKRTDFPAISFTLTR